MNRKLTKSIIEQAKPRDKDYFLWDTEVRNFAVRVHPSGRKIFVFQYRVGRRSRRIGIGPAEVIKVNFARGLAREHAALVSRGGDPLEEIEKRRSETRVKQLAERFDDGHIVMYVKESTGREYRRALRNYILPAFGSKRVSDVTRGDVAQLHYSLRDKPTQANRTLEIVSKMFNLAEEWELRTPGTNPRKGIKKYPEKKRERYLSSAELKRVGEVLAEMEHERIEMPSAIAAVRLLMFTGCRLNEIMTLKWSYLHLGSGFLRLPDSKTGAKDVQLGQPAVQLLERIERVEDNPWVLVGKIEGGRLTDLQPFWQRVRARAGLNDVRIHDLRHTFASVAAEAGMSLPMIGKLLGHKSTQTTSRYAHLSGGTVREAANGISGSIAASMETRAVSDKPARVGESQIAGQDGRAQYAQWCLSAKDNRQRQDFRCGVRK